MADVLFKTNKYGKALSNATAARKPTIAVLGDSYGFKVVTPAIKHCLFTRYAADIWLDERDNASGGRNFAVSSTQTSQLPTQTTQFQANPADVAFIYSGRNNSLSTLANAQSAANDIITCANACLAAGASLVVLHGQAPRGATAVSVQFFLTLNTLLEAYAATTLGVLYLDTTSILIDNSSTSTTQMIWRGGTAGALGSYTLDDIHPSFHAIRQLSALYETPLRMIARQRRPRANLITGQTFHETNFPNIDVLGDASLMQGTSGQLNGVNNTNVPGVTNAIWKVVTGGFGLTATPTIITGPDGYKRLRITVSGTLTANDFVSIDCTPAITLTTNATRLFDLEAAVELTGVTGLHDYYLVMPGSGLNSPFATIFAANQYPDGSNENLFMYTPFGIALTSTSSAKFRAQFYFLSGRTVAGTIDVGRVSVKQVS